MRVQGKVAIVTGGAGGLGAAAARLLASEGAKVVVSDLSEPGIMALAAEIGGLGVVHDVTSAEGWAKLVDQTVTSYGRIDVLVHCAGIEGNREHGGLETSIDEWNKVLGVNLTSGFIAAKAVLPTMREQGTGSIVYLSSAVARIAAKTGLAYGVTKAGVVALSRGIAAMGWQGDARVRCNSVLPGPIRTPMTDRLFAGLAEQRHLSLEELEKTMGKIVPLGSRGDPSDVANAILYLASDESRFVTGAELVVDGGWTTVEEP